MQKLTADPAVRRHWRALMGSGLACSLAATFACAQVVPGVSLTDLSLEELGALNVSAASKRTQPVFVTPAAASVLLAEDVRRSGFETVAEAMRLVPGMHVARQTGSDWAVSARGFNGLSSTKLLVMVDGRTLYSPFYGGVSWSEADVHLADLARIEVVRGPGSTVWGVNAVNGIVNIISRDAHDTTGALISARDGLNEGLDVYARMGGVWGDDTAYRVYVRHTDSRHSLGPDARPGEADAEQSRAGFRLDRHQGTVSRLTVEGEVSRQHIVRRSGEPATPDEVVAESEYWRSFLLTRYERIFSRENRLTLQAYVDIQDGSASGNSVGLGRGASGVTDDGRSIDLDLTHAVRLGDRHDVVWGAGARRAFVDLTLDDTLFVQEPSSHRDLYNVFVQDEITLAEAWRLTLGSKFEHHGGTGDGYLLPNVRVAWTPSSRQTWWAAASRSVRAPSASELDTRLIYQEIPPTQTTPPARVDLVADGTMRSEVLDAFEVGWRFRPSPAVTLDVTAYRHNYERLRNLAPRTVIQPDPFLVITELVVNNDLASHGEGVEASLDWRISEAWRVTAHYSQQTLTVEGDTVVLPLIALDLALPERIWGVQSWWQLPGDLELVLGANGVSAVEIMGVPGYTRFDAQVLWRPRLDVEIALGVQNAFDREHYEFLVGEGFPTVPIRRNVFGRVTWRF